MAIFRSNVFKVSLTLFPVDRYIKNSSYGGFRSIAGPGRLSKNRPKLIKMLKFLIFCPQITNEQTELWQFKETINFRRGQQLGTSSQTPSISNFLRKVLFLGHKGYFQVWVSPLDSSAKTMYVDCWLIWSFVSEYVFIRAELILVQPILNFFLFFLWHSSG